MVRFTISVNGLFVLARMLHDAAKMQCCNGYFELANIRSNFFAAPFGLHLPDSHCWTD